MGIMFHESAAIQETGVVVWAFGTHECVPYESFINEILLLMKEQH